MAVTIENSTPWDSKGLASFLSPLCRGTKVENIKVDLLLAQPGQKRAEQSLYSVCGIDWYNFKKGIYPKEVRVMLLSPKRAAARTDLLDRMAQVDDLATYEIAMPEKIASGISHAFERLAFACGGNTDHRIGDQWEFQKHFVDHKYRGCKCSKPPVPYKFLVRGNTITRTAPPVDIAKLKRRGRWALEAAESYREKMEKNLEKAQKIAKRIIKEEAKVWKAKGDSAR